MRGCWWRKASRVTGPLAVQVADVLDHLVVDMLGAEQAEQAGVGGRDQDGPLAGPAGAQDVVPQDVRVDHVRRRAQQDVSRERSWDRGTGWARPHCPCACGDHVTEEARNLLRGVKFVSHAVQAT